MDQQRMQSLLSVLELTTVNGISGGEEEIAATARRLLIPLCDRVEIQQGNVIGYLGERSPETPLVLLDAHMDQVGFVVTAITEEGFLRVGNVGGLDYRLMPAQRVVVHGKELLPGVICSVPPHLQGEKEHVLSVSELAIDTGYCKEELEQLVSPGDSVTFSGGMYQMAEDCVGGQALDDRCGMAAILHALQLVKGEKLPCAVAVLFSTQEEVGERGASIGAYTINPDIAIAVDVTFALGHGDDPVKCGKLGGGPMIGISPSLSRVVSNQLIAAAKENEIPWQPEVMAGTTGTNADQFSVTRGGIQACTVSIPLRYMHTPTEVIALSDVEQTGKLLAAYLRRCSL